MEDGLDGGGSWESDKAAGSATSPDQQSSSNVPGVQYAATMRYGESTTRKPWDFLINIYYRIIICGASASAPNLDYFASPHCALY